MSDSRLYQAENTHKTPLKFRLTNQYLFGDLRVLARNSKRLVYSARTCWWKIGDPVYSRQGLPLDPRGSVLLETYNPVEFIKAAEESAIMYGRHGLFAFVAAYHGNLVIDDARSLPTAFETWEEYNVLLDKERQNG